MLLLGPMGTWHEGLDARDPKERLALRDLGRELPGHRPPVDRQALPGNRKADDLERARSFVETGRGDNVGHDASVSRLMEQWFSRTEMAATTIARSSNAIS